jgi:hypothetical protein
MKISFRRFPASELETEEIDFLSIELGDRQEFELRELLKSRTKNSLEIANFRGRIEVQNTGTKSVIVIRTA